MAPPLHCIFYSLLLQWVFFILPSLAFSDGNSQHVLTHAAAPRNFSVGFSLQSSFGAAAIIFTGPDGQLETHTTVYHGAAAYREVMRRLSLDSSRHPAPPYEDDDEFWADWPRQAARAALKAVGLPASYEVGVLADVVRHLRSQIEGAFGVRITEAVFTASHLVALYQDDLQDVAAYLGLRYVTPRREFHPLVWETSSVYAGHGRGLCKAWWNATECALEPMPQVALFSVHYSRTALTVALATMYGGGLWEPEYRHSENFTLGREAMAGYANEEIYWEDVKLQLLTIMVAFPAFPKPDLVVVTGDAVERDFTEHLEAALLGNMGRIPEILSGEPVVVAAKGAAEFMRRGPAPWSR